MTVAVSLIIPVDQEPVQPDPPKFALSIVRDFPQIPSVFREF